MNANTRLQVAFPRPCNLQPDTLERATSRATALQPLSLKALARKALARNQPRNQNATGPEKPCNQTCNQNTPAVAQLQPAIAVIRERLLTLAERETVDVELVHALPESELAATIEQIAACDSDVQANVLRGYLRGLRDVDLRRRGKVPADETAAALCRHCGPVWVAPEVANAAPKVNGWAVMLGCPWCHVRKDGVLAIARPPVTCNTCLHYMPDTVNPAAGAGTCVSERNPLRPWPNAVQSCKFWKPKEVHRDGSE